MITENQVTIGIELEMIICGLPDSYPENVEFGLVIQALAPLAEKLGACVIDSATVMGDFKDEVRVAAFNVQDDMSIDLCCPVGRGVEVATPILRNNQWRTAIPEMCQDLRANFELGFNSSTGLHVHIGIGQAYTLQDFRRISKAIILFETQMDTYHPDCRSPLTVDDRGKHNYIKSNRYNRGFKGLSDFECMKVLDKASNIDKLLCKINCNPTVGYSGHIRFYKYNLTSVNQYNTVEFRQAIGISDGDQIVNWVGRVVRFVTSAISTPDEVFNAWAKCGVNDSGVYQRFGVPIPT